MFARQVARFSSWQSSADRSVRLQPDVEQGVLMMKTFTTCIVAAFLLVSRADAQAPNTNAALRYWMAFAVTHDPPADRATAELLDRVAAGTSPWDEAKLGKILDDNREALEIMQRATKLTSCDWGLEYEFGPMTPI